jgi:hypothetical protein
MLMLGADVYLYMFAGLAALGAMVVRLFPLLVQEATPKQGVVLAVTPSQPHEIDRQPFWRRKRDFTRQVRTKLGKLRSAGDGGLPVKASSTPAKHLSKPLPEDTISQPAVDAVLDLPTAEEVPMSKSTVPQSAADSNPVLQTEGTSEPEQASPKSPEVNLLDDFYEELTESSDSTESRDSADYLEDEESDDISGKDSAGKSGDMDSLFEIFSTEIVEENTSGQLASTLDDVDARDLLSEAQQVLKELRSVRARNDYRP